VREEVLRFGQGRSLVGVLTRPSAPAGASGLPAFVLSNAGITHRVGPHRLHVILARRLASLGFPALRFDLSGIGDSGPRTDNAPFRVSALEETREAMSALTEACGAETFVLAGICSGGVVSYRVACADPRVVGAVPINAGGHLHDPSDSELGARLRRRALRRHYWRVAFFSSFSRKNWTKALSGKLELGARLRVMLWGVRGGRLRPARRGGARRSLEEQAAEALRPLRERRVRVLHLYAEGDEWLDYFQIVLGRQVARWPENGRMRFEVIRGTDHTFTLPGSRERLMDLICTWATAGPWS